MSDFFNALETKHHIHLNDQQKAAVIHNKGPALVLAGPGSGKTTVITARTAFLIQEAGIAPQKIMTVTFNKAAQLEMKSRFHKIFGGSHKVLFSTLHSFCYSVIKDYERRQGKRLKLIEGGTGQTVHSKPYILRELYKSINEAAISEDELETLINEIGFVKNRMIRDFECLSLQTKNFQNLYKAYDDYKKQNLLMDFDDMLTYCYSILKRCPDILGRYKDQYGYFQVDEGQDLSQIQFEILKMLVVSEENNLFLVADDDQSIYGFRGAEPRHILELGSYFEELRLFKLENNYRSSKNIVEISSQFIRSNKERFDKSHKTQNPEQFKPQLVRVKDEQEQLAFITKKVKEHFSEKRGTRIAVLYRNNLSSVIIVDQCDREGIAYKLKQNRIHFFQHWLVQDILAFLNFALNPYDQDSFLRIYLRMNRYISKAMVENALNADLKLPILEIILRVNDLKPFQAKKLHEVMGEFKKLAKMTPFKALLYIDDHFKYFAGIKDYCDHTGISADYLYELFGILKSLSVHSKTLPAYISRLEALNQMLGGHYSDTADDGAENHITLTTLHSSKGLEYDVVFMADLTNREIPGDKAFGKSGREKDDSLLEEERRLFYVGMTRAKTWLYLVSPETMNGQACPRSTFLNEVASIQSREINGQIGEGVLIHHKKYGKGVISSVRNGAGNTMIEIDFKGLTRTFDLDVCLENGIITLI